jgi:hypothetical protein
MAPLSDGVVVGLFYDRTCLPKGLIESIGTLVFVR